jgi:hypothetical protein
VRERIRTLASQWVNAREFNRWADLIAVRGGPSGGVRLPENVAFVMKQGEIYEQD